MSPEELEKLTVEENLLNEAAMLLEADDKRRKESGEDFNIFIAANIWRKETTICRVLKEIIDVRGMNPTAEICLRLFCEHVLGITVDEAAIRDAIVRREKTIKDNRRIDLILNIGDKHIPIEGKIGASDQKKQCYDYYTQYAHNSPLYYLTLDGHEPSKESKGSLNNGQIKCISFGEHIRRWLEECLKAPEVKKRIPVSAILTQFLAAIVEMTSREGSSVIMDIAKKMKESMVENYRAAAAIEESLTRIRIEVMKKVFEAISDHMESLRARGFNCEKASTDLGAIERYYNNRDKSWPGIEYPFENGKYRLSFEVNENLYFGITKGVTGKITEDERAQFIEERRYCIDSKNSSFFYWWKYCFGEDRLVNFRTCCGEEYEKLLDKKTFKEKMEEVFSVVDECLEQIGLIQKEKP